MENTEKLSLAEIRAFLQASQEVRFEATGRQEMYEWVTRTLCYQEYWKQKRSIKGLLRQYIAAMTGLRPAGRAEGAAVALPEEVARQAEFPILQRGLWMTTRRPEAVPILEAFLKTEMGEGCKILSRAAARACCGDVVNEQVQAVLSSSVTALS